MFFPSMSGVHQSAVFYAVVSFINYWVEFCHFKKILKTFMCVSVNTKIQLRLVFIFLMEDKNRNIDFKALGPWTEIIWKQFNEDIWAFSHCMQVWKLARQNPPLFPDCLSTRKGHLWSPKQTLQWDKNGLFPSAKEIVWGTNLGSGYRQVSH